MLGFLLQNFSLGHCRSFFISGIYNGSHYKAHLKAGFVMEYFYICNITIFWYRCLEDTMSFTRRRMSMKKDRLIYEESCVRLGIDIDEIPQVPNQRPSYNDDQLGVEFFRTSVGPKEDLSNLMLPRTFFGRSELIDVSFMNTDLSESTLCWNDFIDVDFSFADLHCSDLRASIFTRCNFNNTDLREADLRQSTFEDCTFDGALLEGAILTYSQGLSLALPPDSIAWTSISGPEPDGG